MDRMDRLDRLDRGQYDYRGYSPSNFDYRGTSPNSSQYRMKVGDRIASKPVFNTAKNLLLEK
jgi:hypothetical protein